MSETNNSNSKKPKALTARRVTLLASVAALGAAVLFAGPGGYHPAGLPFGTPSAHAADAATVQPAGFADLVARVKPAVISVKVKMDAVAEPAADHGDGDSGPGGGGSGKLIPDRKHGGYSIGPETDQDSPSPEKKSITAEGSGFFITADGYAVTNNHVVEHAKSVEVTTDDGTVYTARVVGTDPKTDLAVIKVDGKKDFTFVKFADKAPRIGDWVVAVGNPFGLGGSVTAGIVSATGRDIGSGPYDSYIQIDAPINKGNSGGPTFDVNGDVIGVNTAIYSPSGGSVGIGFDIPADTAKKVVTELMETGHVTRGYLGVTIQPVTAAIADSLGMKDAKGAIVADLKDGSPAAKAGIVSGDVITAVNGTPVKDSHDLARTIALLPPDSEVKIDLIRNGQPKTISVTLAEMPGDREAKADTDSAAPSDAAGLPHLGLSVAPASSIKGAGGKGVVVTAVDPNGPAADAGFKPGAIILEVGGKPVSSVGDMRKALADAKSQGKHDVLMRVKVGDGMSFVALPLGVG